MDRRETFDTAAALYHVARPRYPAALFDDLLAITGLRPPARLLEVGAGTGIATLPLAERGFQIEAVELGPALAAVARANLAAYPLVTVHEASFESWPLPAYPFDLVYSACAFAWVDPEVRLNRAAAALRPGGWLAVWTNQHVAGGTAQFFIDVQDCYERFDPETPPGLRLIPAEGYEDDPDHLQASPDFAPNFAPPLFRRYEWELSYSTAAYLDVLHTYSGHIALPEPNHSSLFSCIRELIDGRYGGKIRKNHLTQLMLAQRL
jgi:SAM-dependent methyltransferase